VDRDKVATAVRQLRAALGDTQQSFAHRLKASIRTIAHYESDRPPRGRALAELAKIATAHGHQAQAEIFRHALAEELGNFDPKRLILNPEPHNDVERLWVSTLLEVLRRDQYSHLIPEIAKLLRGPAKRFVGVFLSRKLGTKSERVKVVRQLEEGRSIQDIADQLKIHPEIVEAIATSYRVVEAAKKYELYTRKYKFYL
jgi:transcriptional regulator with XRE-family HTH domain